jgi:O-antigen/teichoic acid export membrane protein
MLAMFFLRSEVSMKGAIVDWEWIKNGFFVSFKYLFAMVFLKTIFFVDKLFVRQFCLPDQLGAYIYYIGGAAAIASFADAAIYVYRYPNLVRVASKGDAKQFAYVFRQMVLHAAVFSFLMLLSAGLFYLIVNHALGNEVYSAYYYQGLVLFSAMFFFSISMAFHYGLYALREDKKIVVSNFISLMTFLSLVVFLGRSGEYRVPLSLLSSMFLLCLIKAIYFKKSHNGFVFSLGKSLI